MFTSHSNSSTFGLQIMLCPDLSTVLQNVGLVTENVYGS